MKNLKSLLLTFAFLTFVCAPVMAAFIENTNLVTDDYRINGTGVYLFSPTCPYNPNGPTQGQLWNQNNQSPIDFRYNPDYFPSPGKNGGWKGEKYDLEGLFYSYDAHDGSLKVWLVSSLRPNGFNRVHIGDVFIDSNGDDAFDYALMGFGKRPGFNEKHRVKSDGFRSWDKNNDREAGGLAVLDENSTLHGINGSGSYDDNPSIRNLTNPWAVNFASEMIDGNLQYEKLTGDEIEDMDFAGGPAGLDPRGCDATFVYMWDADIGTGLNRGDFGFHVTVQCGNDAIWEANSMVPVPGALLMAGLGIALVTGLSKHKNRKSI